MAVKFSFLFPLFLTSLPSIEHNYDKFTNDLLEKLEGIDRFMEAPGPANAAYFEKQIERDLQPFQNGIDEKFVIASKGFGVSYKILNGSIYRANACVFPARCAGVEYFLRKLAPTLKNTEFVLNDFDHPRVPVNGQKFPVFSFSKNPLQHLDILYPAWAFWEGGPAISTYPKGIGDWDEMRKKVLSSADRLPWKEKRNTAFFLGSRTSAHRDTLVLLSRKKPDLVDAQYTKNQAYKGPDDTLGLPAAEEKPFEYNCQYKYLVNFRGVAASFRYKHLFLCNSVVLHLEDGMIEFFYHKLIPYYHYIRIEENTEKYWTQMIEFLQQHDDIAEKIAKRAQEWVRAKLTNRDVLNYWRKLLVEYTKLLKYNVKPDESFQKIH